MRPDSGHWETSAVSSSRSMAGFEGEAGVRSRKTGLTVQVVSSFGVGGIVHCKMNCLGFSIRDDYQQ